MIQVEKKEASMAAKLADRLVLKTETWKVSYLVELKVE